MYLIKKYLFPWIKISTIFFGIIISCRAAPPKLRIVIPDRYISPIAESFFPNGDNPGLFQYEGTAFSGDYFRGPEGVYWSDMLRTTQGNPSKLEQELAMAHCDSVGARLPTKSDYTNLVLFVRGGQEYTSNCGLPNLDGYEFWTSSLYDQANREEGCTRKEARCNGLTFDGTQGKFVIHQVIEKKNFRCVFDKG